MTTPPIAVFELRHTDTTQSIVLEAPPFYLQRAVNTVMHRTRKREFFSDTEYSLESLSNPPSMWKPEFFYVPERRVAEADGSYGIWWNELHDLEAGRSKTFTLYYAGTSWGDWRLEAVDRYVLSSIKAPIISGGNARNVASDIPTLIRVALTLSEVKPNQTPVEV